MGFLGPVVIAESGGESGILTNTETDDRRLINQEQNPAYRIYE